MIFPLLYAAAKNLNAMLKFNRYYLHKRRSKFNFSLLEQAHLQDIGIKSDQKICNCNFLAVVRVFGKPILKAISE